MFFYIKDTVNLLSLTSLNLQTIELGTPLIGNFLILWDEIGLWEPIGIKKSLKVVERNSFIFTEQKP